MTAPKQRGRQTPAALARRAAFEAAANDPYVRIYKEAERDAENAYKWGCMPHSETGVLEVEVECRKAQLWAVGLYERCQYLEWQIARLEAQLAAVGVSAAHN